jgi:uncharacterized protein
VTGPGGFAALPPYAAWRFVDAVDGFEVVYPGPHGLRGHTSAVEDGRAYAVHYEISVDERWRTREARVSSDTVDGPRSIELVSDGAGRWTLDGVAAPHLDGLLDVDLEASAGTNTLPVHRLDLPEGSVVAAPAVYVRALDLAATRLEQSYRRRGRHAFDHTSGGGEFEAALRYDGAGLVVDYPGIATRSA